MARSTRHARPPHEELRDQGGELRDRQPLNLGNSVIVDILQPNFVILRYGRDSRPTRSRSGWCQAYLTVASLASSTLATYHGYGNPHAVQYSVSLRLCNHLIARSKPVVIA